MEILEVTPLQKQGLLLSEIYGLAKASSAPMEHAKRILISMMEKLTRDFQDAKLDLLASIIKIDLPAPCPTESVTRLLRLFSQMELSPDQREILRFLKRRIVETEKTIGIVAG